MRVPSPFARYFLPLFAILLLQTLPIPVSRAQNAPTPTLATAATGDYILIGWNDLGMHCANARFQDLTVLPPYNTLWATVIRRGDPARLPEVVTSDITVSYRFQDNTYSVGKTDFWTYASQIFGTTIPPNIGLTGRGLTGTMDAAPDHFHAEGIPLTEYTDSDLVNKQPFQLAELEARDASQALLASTEIVAPISTEMMCSNCHHPRTGETVEHSILRLHDEENGTHLATSTPVLCASCHASNALGAPGTPGLPSLSEAMHDQHAEETNNCYQCHPGPNTQCLRGTMATDFHLVCQNCHGSVRDVAESIKDGRRPWLDEPRCETCHGSTYAEAANTLYRNSNNGHGNLYCPTCHNSPHAILPSREERDNRQTVALQGATGTLRRCDVCHGYTPTGAGPHGFVVTGVGDQLPGNGVTARVMPSPNPFGARTEISYEVLGNDPIHLAVYDANGREVRVLTRSAQTPGHHTLVWDGRDEGGRAMPAGIYFCRIQTEGRSAAVRLVKVGT